MQDGITLQSLTVSIMVDGAFQCISIDPLLYHLFQVYYTKYPFLLCHLCLYPLLYSKGIFHDASLCITFLQRGAQA